MVGLSIAWELSRRNKSVCVVDRQHLGTETSWAAAGILPPPLSNAKHDAVEQLRVVGHQLHSQWSEELLAETGIDNGLRKCGGLYFARTIGEATSLRVAMLEAEEQGVMVEELSPSEFLAKAPTLGAIGGDIKVAYYLPDEMQIRSPRHLQALMKACESRGVQLRPNVNVEGVATLENRAVGVRTASGLLEAQETILCGGAWTASLLEPLGIVLPIEPWRGQLILWKTDAPLAKHVVNEGLRYLVPRDDGHLVVGATVEDVGFDCQTTEEAIEELKAYSYGLVPELRHAKIEKAWAGLRPKTPDGHPFMTRVPGCEGLSLAAGHYRSGIHLAPVTAVFMAELLLHDTTEIDGTPFRLNR